MYFQLKRDKFTDIGIVEPEGLPLNLSFIRGAVITTPVDPSLIFTTNAVAQDSLPDFSGGSIPVMSQRFLTLLTQAGIDNLQTFPILIKSDIDGNIWDGFFAVNILGLIQCADLSKSDYGEIFHGLYDFDTLAIDIKKVNGALFFRLQESPSMIIMHKSIGKYIMENDPDQSLTGWDVEEIIQ
jgi:hypothetical protein